MEDNLLLEHLLDWGNDKGEKVKRQEKAWFRNDNAEPLWKDFKLWAASAILDVPKDSNIY